LLARQNLNLLSPLLPVPLKVTGKERMQRLQVTFAGLAETESAEPAVPCSLNNGDTKQRENSD
jgi:hypothetical protein